MLHVPAALQGVSISLLSLELPYTDSRLYCSSECRLQDKGFISPAPKPAMAPVHLTARLPVSLSPRHRPTAQIGPSPKMPPHVPVTHGPNSSSSSSITSSPIHSPRTNPSGSGSDSPQKDPFDLPPPAFPQQASLNFPGSMPVKIPNLVKASPAVGPTQTPASHGSTILPLGASIETLHFGRKPSVTNTVISPNALLPRCACGKVAGHSKRRPSKDRGMETGFSNLSLGPSLLASAPGRVVSAPAKAASGHGTPRFNTNSNSTYSPTPLQTVSSVIGASQLSRSRSDPIPPSPPNNMIAPFTRQDDSLISPIKEHAERPTLSDRRGRSLERQRHQGGQHTGVLNQVQEREQAPSRSRHRREERERDRRERERLDVVAEPNHARISPSFVENPHTSPISPSWSRQTSPKLERNGSHRNTGGTTTPVRGGQKSPQDHTNGMGGREEGRVGRQTERVRPVVA